MTLSNNKFNTIENISSAIARTLSTNKEFTVSFQEQALKNETNKNIRIDSKTINTKTLIRGKIDFFSFKERFLSNKIYNEFKPNSEKKTELYELIHNARSTVLGIKFFPGSFNNIIDYLAIKQKNDFKLDYLIKDYKKIFGFFLEFFCEKKIFKNQYKLPLKKKQIELILKQRKIIKSHQEFSILTLKFVDSFFRVIDDINHEDDKNDVSSQIELEEKNEKDFQKMESEDSVDVSDQDSLLEEINNGEENNSELNATDESDISNKLANKYEQYKIYTRKYDLIANASELADRDELNTLKKKLDEDSPKFDSLIKKLSTKLERKLMANKIRSWEFDLEEGTLDSSRLSRIILNPNDNLTFKKEIESAAKNTVVSLLIDNSGSMRGRPIIIAANAVEVLTKTLERCGVKVEILGFTTKEWKGGKSKIDWNENNKPNKPGRLNDLLHIIYKNSEMSWKNCNKNIGLVLKDGILKENIDGEALIWANQRLLMKEEKRKILIVISDGAPVDDSTLSANNSNILESHLAKTVRDIQSANKIEILAIGIGHDVSKYYTEAFTIDSADKLAETMLEKITDLFKK